MALGSGVTVLSADEDDEDEDEDEDAGSLEDEDSLEDVVSPELSHAASIPKSKQRESISSKIRLIFIQFSLWILVVILKSLTNLFYHTTPWNARFVVKFYRFFPKKD
jgi:hypothetical protein